MKEYEELLKEFDMEQKEPEKEEKYENGPKTVNYEFKKEEHKTSTIKMSGVFDGTVGEENKAGKEKIYKGDKRKAVKGKPKRKHVPKVNLSDLRWRNIILVLVVVIIMALVVMNLPTIISFFVALFWKLVFAGLIIGGCFWLIRGIIRGR